MIIGKKVSNTNGWHIATVKCATFASCLKNLETKFHKCIWGQAVNRSEAMKKKENRQTEEKERQTDRKIERTTVIFFLIHTIKNTIIESFNNIVPFLLKTSLLLLYTKTAYKVKV